MFNKSKFCLASNSLSEISSFLSAKVFAFSFSNIDCFSNLSRFSSISCFFCEKLKVLFFCSDNSNFLLSKILCFSSNKFNFSSNAFLSEFNFNKLLSIKIFISFSFLISSKSLSISNPFICESISADCLCKSDIFESCFAFSCSKTFFSSINLLYAISISFFSWRVFCINLFAIANSILVIGSLKISNRLCNSFFSSLSGNAFTKISASSNFCLFTFFSAFKTASVALFFWFSNFFLAKNSFILSKAFFKIFLSLNSFAFIDKVSFSIINFFASSMLFSWISSPIVFISKFLSCNKSLCFFELFKVDNWSFLVLISLSFRTKSFAFNNALFLKISKVFLSDTTFSPFNSFALILFSSSKITFSGTMASSYIDLLSSSKFFISSVNFSIFLSKL